MANKMIATQQDRKQWPWMALGAIIGITVWSVASLVANNPDPTGSRTYWIFGYPTLLVASFGIALYARLNTWTAGLTMIAAQLIVTLLFSKGDSTQLIFGLMAYVLYALPLVLASWLGFWISTKRSK